MPATKGRIATETSVSGRSSLTILTIAIMIQIRPSKISMPAKPRISQIRSTSSRTRARSSPVLFFVKVFHRKPLDVAEQVAPHLAGDADAADIE